MARCSSPWRCWAIRVIMAIPVAPIGHGSTLWRTKDAPQCLELSPEQAGAAPRHPPAAARPLRGYALAPRDTGDVPEAPGNAGATGDPGEPSDPGSPATRVEGGALVRCGAECGGGGAGG